MSYQLTLYINNEEYPLDGTQNSFSIREFDELQFVLQSDQQEGTEPEIYCEDYCIEGITKDISFEGVVYTTPRKPYFAESFGYAVVKIEWENTCTEIIFDVHARKIHAEQAEKIIEYLAQHQEQLAFARFTRTSFPVGMKPEQTSTPELVLQRAESFVEKFQHYKTRFLASKRSRLVPQKQPIWKANQLNIEIDPIDVLNNLDALSPTHFEGDVFLRGRQYAVDDIDVTALIETNDILENQILLGGVYSMQHKIRALLNEFDELTPQQSALRYQFEGYESFSRLCLKVSCGNMKQRAEILLYRLADLIRLLQEKLAVSYQGQIQPVITPYVRSSQVYRILFNELSEWYKLGLPSLGYRNFLMKLRSLSKLFEFFTLFQIIEKFKSGWEIIDAIPHTELADIPKRVIFEKQNVRVTLDYEQQIYPYSPAKTQHLQLISVAHNKRENRYSHWKPDFILKFDFGNEKVQYVILDAKYSRSKTVEELRLPEIINKYYWGIATFDRASNIATNHHTAAIIAIYPLLDNFKAKVDLLLNPLEKKDKQKHRASSHFPLFPVIKAIGVGVTDQNTFTECFQQLESQLWAMHKEVKRVD